MKHAFAIILFLLSCTALGAEPMAATIDRYVRTLGVDVNDCILSAKNSKYLDKLKNESGFSGSPVVFGKLGGDHLQLSGKALVGSPIEYYYTDLVFMEEGVREGADGAVPQPGGDAGQAGRGERGDRVVKEVARRRGERCDEQAAKARYARDIRAEIEAAGRQFSVNKNELDLIKSYYLAEINYNNFQKE
jgi:hypothetical protein